jgi:pyruvate,water dikinase
MMDDLFFGAQPGIPPYVEAPGDKNPERFAAVETTFNWVMTTDHVEEPANSRKLVDRLRAERPNLDAMSNNELYAYARKIMLAHFRQLFMEHIFISFVSPLPIGALTQICAAVGRPDDAMRAISGVGDVESAAPSLAMWELRRSVAADPALTAAFNAGVTGLVDRLRGAGPSGTKFLASFEEFLGEFGSRGPNEWEMRNHTWETKPELALAAIDRMRLAGADAAPARRNEEMAATRQRVVAEITELLAGDPETQGMFQAAARAAVLFQAARERTKTNAVKLIQEARMAMHTIGRRLVAEGKADEVSDFGLVLTSEMEGWLANPASLRGEIRRRRELFAAYAALQEPFVFNGRLPDPSTWARRGAAAVAPVAAGDVLAGFAGCPGEVTGVARVVLDPLDPTALAAGEILVAPITDPSWTPLFVAAGGVIVDVGAAQSHAMIVSRELGIPCVPSVSDATRRIPDGATVHVNGDAGTVTILAVP